MQNHINHRIQTQHSKNQNQRKQKQTTNCIQNNRHTLLHTNIKYEWRWFGDERQTHSWSNERENKREKWVQREKKGFFIFVFF